jgi:hypothetical protein
MRNYGDSVTYKLDTIELGGEKPMTCRDCGEPMFWSESEEDGVGYHHATLYGCGAPWALQDIDDPSHPLRSPHPFCDECQHSARFHVEPYLLTGYPITLTCWSQFVCFQCVYEGLLSY